MSDILVVDDNEMILSLVEEVAELHGYDVRATNNAHDFFSAYDKQEPDIMLVDVVMPEMDGLEVIRRLVQMNSKTPLIIMSGYDYVDSNGISLLAQNLNLLGFLKKPFDVDELIEIMSGSLNQVH
ncbi:MAG: response regulator [Gammaproteobacteria bacterium]|nr:response regulator [Gammaproteobacteria bacterium]